MTPQTVRPLLAAMLAAAALGAAAPSRTIDFVYGIDESLFRPEITTSGGGNGEFNMYVNSGRTSFVKNRTLFVKPTLTEHVMADLQSTGNLYVPKLRLYVNNTEQPVTETVDDYYGGAFAGRRMVLPYKHMRYQTPLSNFCDDTDSASPDTSSCTNQWEHAFNVMDMTRQAWGSGRWGDVRCASECVQVAGDYVDEGSATNYTYTMLQPISSARLTTRVALDIRYGRIELTAKLPRGDWLWPAMWLLPSHPDNYGIWPANGEIDLMESRGNPSATCDGGNNAFGSTLHWGPNWQADAYMKSTTSLRFSKHNTTLTDDFHVYGLSWNESGIYTYLDSPDNIVLETPAPTGGFWGLAQQSTDSCVQKDADTGGFHQCEDSVTVPAEDWSNFTNPWAAPNNFSATMAPFDTPFYLILNVAVGGSNGFFQPSCKGSDGSSIPWGAPGELPTDEFMKAGYRWLPTWVDAEDMAWAAHCSLGSALQLCMPSNSASPVHDMTQAGASDQLRAYYEANAAKCTGAPSASACAALGAACEWHETPCPDVADHAALQVKSIAVFDS